jgi:hypothetical protein
MMVTMFALVPALAHAEGEPAAVREPVRVVNDATGSRLQVGGRDFLVRGMNWDYIPIGQNYAFDLWGQPETMITAALDREMSLMAGMGVNAIRVSAGIPPRWVRYIHDRYGIYCIINHTVGRYGFTLDGVYNTNTDYSNPRMRAAISADVAAAFQPYKDVPGVLMFLLGNENNYGLSWSSFEIEALPKGEQNTARARFLYSLFEEITVATKAQDPGVPVAIANGDAQYIDLVAEECKDIDIFGTNVYRGISARDLYQVVKEKLGIPVMYTEFGCDAFNARDMREDQAMQAKYLIGQWHEIYQQSAGHGRVGNAIGGCIFQWSDGWWKYKQEERLDVHDTNASWPDGGFEDDFAKGENNMNEEWWGICAKGFPDGRSLYELYPRAAYYAMRKVFALDPYAKSATDEAIASHFAAITPGVAALEARGDRAALATNTLERARISGVRMDLETISTRATLTRPPVFGDPAFQGYDKFQSFFADFQANPDPSVTGKVSINFRGDVPRNPIDQIFYENRRDPSFYGGSSGIPDRVRVYQASMSWDDRWFTLDGFYRTGHFHWGYEGDFFGLYREANYGPNLDTYDGQAPVGFEMAGKRQFNGLKLAYGPQLWWGANPAVYLKYRRQVGRFDATIVHENDIARQGSAVTTATIPLQPTAKTALYLKTNRGPFGIEAGGIWAGQNKVDRPYQVEDPATTQVTLRDYVRQSDAFGGKLKVMAARGRLQWYAQGASMGLVADAGPTATTTYTGWNLKDTGSGNQRNLITGFIYSTGRFQFGPNFLWQKPIVGPMPQGMRSPGRLRNIFDDPFAVRDNREMTGAELVISYDPTPATWLFAWDNDVREDARLAASAGLTYRHMRTGRDAAIGFLADGVTYFATEVSAPARDLWEVNGRFVSRVSSGIRAVAHAYYGTAEPNVVQGSPLFTSAVPTDYNLRVITRSGADVKLVGAGNTLTAAAKFNDFGPYDYYRDYGLTYPVQLSGELSHSLGSPQWFDTNPQTRIGVRATWRSLDQWSPRYLALPGDPNGSEWEFRTYLKLAI